MRERERECIPCFLSLYQTIWSSDLYDIINPWKLLQSQTIVIQNQFSLRNQCYKSLLFPELMPETIFSPRPPNSCIHETALLFLSIIVQSCLEEEEICLAPDLWFLPSCQRFTTILSNMALEQPLSRERQGKMSTRTWHRVGLSTAKVEPSM